MPTICTTTLKGRYRSCGTHYVQIPVSSSYPVTCRRHTSTQRSAEDEQMDSAEAPAPRSSRRDRSVLTPQSIFDAEKPPSQRFFRCGAKPYVRWWWLAGPFCPHDIHNQLDWIKAMGFGGVELAWLWPTWLGSKIDQKSIPRWLSPEWSSLVAEAKRYADQIGLGCDFTFGSCWPFGGSCVPSENASQTFDGSPTQHLDRSWEDPLGRTALRAGPSEPGGIGGLCGGPDAGV